jgi:hypothetical protein
MDPSTGEWSSEVIAGSDTFDVLQCLGCESVTFAHQVVVPSLDHDETTLYPPRVSRRQPKWHRDLPLDLGEIVRQVYTALQNGHGALALMGARTIVDMIILEKVGDRGNFHAKLQALQAEGYIASRARNVLDAALDAGNASAHRGHNPDADTVNEVMDIVESLLEAIYRHDGIAERLRASTPQRSRANLRVVDPTPDGSGSAS